MFATKLIALVAVSLGGKSCPAEQPRAAENVILVTMDGLRFQELFTGADERLINKEDGNVEKPELTKARFWNDDAHQRREQLMPFLWTVVAQQGQIFGSPEHQSQVMVENGRYFSYPGYNELLSGVADKSIWSNAKFPNKHVTVLEWLHKKPEFEGRVAAFCSWDVFPYIINESRSGIPVNAGWEPLTTAEDPQVLDSYNRLAEELPRYWQSVRYDAFTFRGAIESMKVDQPRVLYVALGETDDWAHAGRYDLYLEAAKTNDDYIRQLWEQAQSMSHYRDKTALLIATDHGRGDGREGWENHSAKLIGSERIWIAVMGAGVPALGVRQAVEATQGQVAATVAALLGYDFTTHAEGVAPPLSLETDDRPAD